MHRPPSSLRIYSWFSFLLEAETAGSKRVRKDYVNENFRHNRNPTHDFPACSAVPQPTAPPACPRYIRSSTSSSSSSSCLFSHFVMPSFECFLFLNPQDEVGPSISSSVVLCSFVLLVDIVVLVLVFYLCPSSVRVVANFPGSLLFPLLCSVLLFLP